MDTEPVDWNRTLREQWEWHWNQQVRPRLQGLTDDEYFWVPTGRDDVWTVRPRGTSPLPQEFGVGDHVIDYLYPEPAPAPFTTIAWRLGHVIVGVLAMRNASYFGAPDAAYHTWEYAGGAKTAMEQFETHLEVWTNGVRSLSPEQLAVPVGDKEPFPDLPMAYLVLHIQRELIHHLSEICLLRDLYLHSNGKDTAR